MINSNASFGVLCALRWFYILLLVWLCLLVASYLDSKHLQCGSVSVWHFVNIEIQCFVLRVPTHIVSYHPSFYFLTVTLVLEKTCTHAGDTVRVVHRTSKIHNIPTHVLMVC